MRKTILKGIILVGVVGLCSQLLATTGELRTPLARFPYHYPLTPVDDGLWSFNCFHTAYMRSADKAFDVCHGRNSVHLSKLFFGKSEFRGEEAFAGGIITVPWAPPVLKFAKIRPRFEYCEKGLNFAIETERRFDDSKWRFGGQLSLPFKVIDVERNVCSATMTELEESIDDVVCRKSETLWKDDSSSADAREPKAIVPAYRLDFLSGLCQANGMPMVEYGIKTDGADHQGSVRIAGIEVAGRPAPATLVGAAVLYNTDGTCPAYQYASPTSGYTADAVTGRPAVSGIDDLIQLHFVTEAGGITAAQADSRGAFTSTQDYTASLASDRDAQSKLYIVPVYKDDTLLDNEVAAFTDQAVIMMNAIETAISDLQQIGVISAEQFFFDKCVYFCQCDRLAALGDLDLNLYAGYDFNDDFWGKLNVGVIFPTGKKLCDVGQLLAQAPGNNGHFEVKVGLDLGWKRWKWMAWHLDAYYNHVFSATEWRAAPFLGATVKNIGPVVQAKVKWGYFTGHLDCTIFHPENQNLGCSFGYEAYVKRCDKVCLCATTATEFELTGCCGQCAVQNSEEKELDASILAQDTKRISHKLRGSVFHRWNYCEIFAGASRVIGGKNIMREAEGHVGFGIYW